TTRGLGWRIRATVAGPLSLGWKILPKAQVGLTLQLGWSVFGQAVFAGGRRRIATVARPPLEVPQRHEPRVTVRAELALAWQVRSSVAGASLELGWQIRSSAAGALQASWRVRRAGGVRLRA